MTGQQDSNTSQNPAGAIAGAARSRRAFPRILTIFFLLVFVAGFAFVGGFAAFATHVSRLATPVELADADAIIVLTGGEKRLDAAVDLLRSGKGQRLLISGVHPAARLVDLQRATGGDATLFSCCVDIDRAALDTIGNAEESAKWVNSHHWNSVIVVTNNYHMPRSLLELRRMVGDTDLFPYPVVNTRLDGGEWITNRAALRVLFKEYAKYLAAVARGVLPGLEDLARSYGEPLEASASRSG
jgi:uncharacterized SAM-binding protein YcdF (DUF218 family)